MVFHGQPGQARGCCLGTPAEIVGRLHTLQLSSKAPPYMAVQGLATALCKGVACM